MIMVVWQNKVDMTNDRKETKERTEAQMILLPPLFLLLLVSAEKKKERKKREKLNLIIKSFVC